MESSRYSSVRDQIITKARGDPYKKSTLEIVEQMEKMRELAELHKPKSYTTCFTEQERKWLVELLCWESFCMWPQTSQRIAPNWIQFLMPRPSFQASDHAVQLNRLLSATAMCLSASNAWERDRQWRSIALIFEWSLVNPPSIPITRLGLIWRMALIQHVLLVMLREYRSWRLVGCLFEWMH
jgi:hypothetical protein